MLGVYIVVNAIYLYRVYVHESTFLHAAETITQENSYLYTNTFRNIRPAAGY